MRCLEVLSDLNRGGAGVYLENLLRHAAQDMEFHVALPQGAAMSARLREAGATVHECPMKGNASYDKGDVALLGDLIRRLQPALVHTHGSLSGRMAARKAGKARTLYTKHTLSTPRAGLKGKAAALLDDRLTDACIAVSGASRQNLLDDGMKPHKIHLIYNGIEGFDPPTPAGRTAAREGLPVPEDALVLLCAARLEPVKNHALLLRAFSRAAEQHPQLHLLLAGDGALRAGLETLASLLPGGERIHFLGERDDMPRLYAAADLFALTSHSENMPLTVLEAMSAGLPCLLTEVGGMAEAAVTGETALLVPDDDLVAAAAALTHLCGNEDLRQTLGQNGRARYEARFTARVFAEETQSLYRKLVNGQ
ncbi:MAG: glycosyltransferase [Clostridia bacterium]|nr:glycosyltransferase [Clostridia bacterium]